MTPAAAAPLQAGRELDALVAERVMGMTLGCQHVEVLNLGGTLMECRACKRQFGVTTLAMAVHAAMPEPYSTDIAAAFEVVAAMESKWWWFSLETYPSPYGTNDGATVLARFKETGMPGQKDSEGYADTAPLAICRAALAAVSAPEVAHG